MKHENPERLSMQHVARELVQFVTWEKGALYTTKQLLLKPGRTTRRYLDGERTRLTNPIRYLLMSTALVTFAFVAGMPRATYLDQAQMGEFAQDSPMFAAPEEDPQVGDMLIQVEELISKIEAEVENPYIRVNCRRALDVLQASFMEQMAEISLTWMNVFLLGALPINAVISRLAFRHAQLNLAEHIAVNAYILGIQNIVGIGLVVAAYLGPIAAWSTPVYLLLSFLYQFWAWRQAFELQGAGKVLWGLAVLVLSIFSFLLLQGVAMAVIYQLVA